MNFLVDENMPRSLAPQIAALGFFVQDVRDIGLRGHPDTEVMATAIATDGIVEPMQWLVEALMGQLKLLLVRLLELEAEIEALFSSLPDAALFSALPGAGPHLAPRLLAAFGSDRSRFRTAQEMQRYSGIAPVRESSGQKNWVHW